MPLKTTDAIELRRDFVELAGRGGCNMAELCRRFGISPPAGYKWLARHRAGEGLEERPRKPRKSPGKTEAAMEEKIVAARQAHPVRGGRKLKRWLEKKTAARPVSRPPARSRKCCAATAC